MQLAYREQRRSRRYRTPLTVGYVCFDWLDEQEASRQKRGDLAVDVTAALAEGVRGIDAVARMGPGEFAGPRPHGDAQGARLVFERDGGGLEEDRTRW